MQKLILSCKEIGKRIYKDLKKYGIGIIAILIYYLVTQNVFHQFCPSVIIFGLPCAGCGITRAFICLITGHLKEALIYNAGVFIWVITICYAMAGRYVFGKKLKGTKVLLAAAIIFSIVYYVYRMKNFPSGISPMVYNENNLLRHIIPFYDKIIHKIFLYNI